MRRFSCISFLLMSLLLCLAACGTASQNAPTSTGASTATSVPTPIQGQFGEPVTLPGWQVTIERAKLAASNDGFLPTQAGDVFLLLQVTLKNTSSAAQTASDSPFYCRGADGTKYDLIAAGNPSIDGPVAAGEAARGQVAFEVPSSAHQFTVFYSTDGLRILAEWTIHA